MRFKTIVLDFDGTLIESAEIKNQAFRIIFEDYPEYLDRIMRYHFSHSATIRYEKFRYITEKILRQPYSKEKEKKLDKEFSRIVFEQSLNCSFVEGAKEFLDYFFGKIPLYLASINPMRQLIKILNARNLKKYFKKIYAHPWIKEEAIRDIIIKENIARQNIVFIGDTLEDYRAAEKNGVFFIGRDANLSFKKNKIPAYKSFVDITKAICNDAK